MTVVDAFIAVVDDLMVFETVFDNFDDFVD